jgi:hypothetical protein
VRLTFQRAAAAAAAAADARVDRSITLFFLFKPLRAPPLQTQNPLAVPKDRLLTQNS